MAGNSSIVSSSGTWINRSMCRPNQSYATVYEPCSGGYSATVAQVLGIFKGLERR